MLTFVMRAFALSFSIFWRALPMWLLLAGVLYALLTMLEENPIIFLFLLSVASGTLIYFMMFSHIRVGLSVLGETTEPDLAKLLRKSFGFFRFVAAWTAMVGGLTVAGFFALGKLGLFDWDRMLELVASTHPDDIAEFNALFAAGPVQAYFLVAQIAAQLAYCAVAVPMAANAAACSPKARDYEIFWGFGAHTLRMFLLTLVSFAVLSAAAIAYVALALGIFGQMAGLFGAFSDPARLSPEAIVAALEQVPASQWYLALGVLVALPLMALVWWVSLWCAGATLCFVEERDRREAKFRDEIERIYEKPLDEADLRALRLARMQGRCGPTPA